MHLTVLVQQDSAAAQQYIRQGSPTALRAELWALILNISSQPEVRSKEQSSLFSKSWFFKAEKLPRSSLFTLLFIPSITVVLR